MSARTMAAGELTRLTSRAYLRLGRAATRLRRGWPRRLPPTSRRSAVSGSPYLSRAPKPATSRLKPHSASAAERGAQLRRARERLQHHAVALGQPQQRVELVGRGRRVEVEAQPDRLEADGR